MKALIKDIVDVAYDGDTVEFTVVLDSYISRMFTTL